MEFDSPASSATALPSDDSIFSSPVSVASTLSTSSSQDLTIGPSSQATFGARQLATFTSSTGATVLEPTLDQLVSSFSVCNIDCILIRSGKTHCMQVLAERNK